jgi:hypothetical protein
VYTKTADGWTQMAPAHLQNAMRTRGPNSSTALFRSIFGDLVDPSQYEGLKKQLMTREDREEAFNERFGDALGTVGEDAKLARDLFASLFGPEDPVTGLYKKPTQPAYAMVLKLPRGMKAQDVFAPVPLPPPEQPATFLPPAETLLQIFASAPPPLEETTYPFTSEQDTPPPKPPKKKDPPLVVEEDNPPPYVNPEAFEAPARQLITELGDSPSAPNLDAFDGQGINQVFPIATGDMALTEGLEGVLEGALAL